MLKIKTINANNNFLFGVSIFIIVFVYTFKSIIPFDGLEFNGDSYRYYLAAIDAAKSMSDLKLPPPAFWPYGYPLLAGFAFKAIGPSYESAQLISVIASIGLFFVMYLIANKSSANQTLALVSSLLLTFLCGFVLKYQMMIMSDMPALFWSSLTICFLLLYLKKRQRRYLFLLSFSIVFAMLTRYVYGLSLFVVIVVLFIERSSFKKFLVEIILVSLTALILSTPQLMLNLQSLHSSLYHPWLQNWNITNFWVMDRTSVDGHLYVNFPNVIYYLSSAFRWSEFTPIGFVIFLSGIVISVRNRFSDVSKTMIIWFLVFYLFLSGIPIQNPRFALSLYLPIFYFHFEFFRYIFTSKFRLPAIGLTILLILFKGFSSSNFLLKSIQEKNAVYSDAKEFLKIVPTNSLIITWDFFEAYYIYFPNQPLETIHKIDKEKAKLLFAKYDNVFLILDEERLQNAWGHLPPNEMYKWIKGNYPFRLILEKGKYKVWKSTK